jgi:hypothetical protein
MSDEGVEIEIAKKAPVLTVEQTFDKRVKKLRDVYQKDRRLKGREPTPKETNNWIVGQVVNGLEFAGYPVDGSDDEKNQAIDTIAGGLGKLSQSRLEDWAEAEGNGSKLLSKFLISPQQQKLITRVNGNKEKTGD